MTHSSTHPPFFFYYRSAPFNRSHRFYIELSPPQQITRQSLYMDQGPPVGETLRGRAELERMLDGDMPWLTWFLLRPRPHPYRHMIMVFGSVLGRARGAPGISSILSGVSPPPRSSGSSSNLPPCFQEPRNVNLLVPEPCNSQSPSCRPPGCGEQSIAKVLCCVAAVLLEMWEGREWQGHQPSPLSGNGRLWLWRGLEGNTLPFSFPAFSSSPQQHSALYPSLSQVPRNQGDKLPESAPYVRMLSSP